jgi:hypothetical protein
MIPLSKNNERYIRKDPRLQGLKSYLFTVYADTLVKFVCSALKIKIGGFPGDSYKNIGKLRIIRNPGNFCIFLEMLSVSSNKKCVLIDL